MTRPPLHFWTGPLIALIVLLDVTLVRKSFGFSILLNLSLLSVLMLTCITGVGAGIMSAVVIGMMFDFLSTLPFGVHLLALAAASLIAYGCIRRLFATRSVISLLVSVSIGTISYYTILWSLSFAVQQVDPHALVLPWRVMAASLAGQAVVHPALVWAWWVLRRRRGYAFLRVSQTNY